MIIDKLEELDIRDNTVVFFSGDNGPAATDHDVTFFGSVGPFRGWKDSLYEGGIR